MSLKLHKLFMSMTDFLEIEQKRPSSIKESLNLYYEKCKNCILALFFKIIR